MLDGRNKGHSSFPSRRDSNQIPEHELTIGGMNPASSSRKGKEARTSDMEMMRERFAKLLLGEDMSGGEKGVTSALALSNAITKLADSMFGEQMKLQPMDLKRKKIWRKEMDWLLSVVDHIVQFVPSKQVAKTGDFTEIMVTKQREDLLMNIPALRKLDTVLLETLDKFKDHKDFWYVPKDVENTENINGDRRKDVNWCLPVKVPSDGLSEESQGEDKPGGFPLQDITDEYFDPGYFLSSVDLSSKHKVLDLKNRIEASMVIWKRKMNHKEQWGSFVSLEKRELFEVRVETILAMLKEKVPEILQSSLEISKIKNNKDVGHAILESYSRVLESLASKIMTRIDDVLEADVLVHIHLMEEKERRLESDVEPEYEKTEKVVSAVTPNSTKLADLIGWRFSSDTEHSLTGDIELFQAEQEKEIMKSPIRIQPMKLSYLAKLENLRSPSERH
ncbi:Rop guanine nucleotide exchange factor 10 [Raphanus sativus]|nr:Rop guanine nucleotide exchange factor 10 [Raphanus sativus]